MPSLILPGSSPLRPVMVVSLDGLPHSLLRERAEMPGSPWRDLLATGTLKRITSSRPEMSSVAWASYLTGVNPGGHRVFGFVDAKFTPRPHLIYPNRHSVQAPTVLDRVRDAGGTAVSINVPMTGPPAPQPGVVIGGFLGGELPGNIHPPEQAEPLRDDGYLVDTDPALAYENRDAYLDSLLQAQDARIRAARRLAVEQPWDYFHLHLMETDRLFHFYWGEDTWADGFDRLLTRAEAAAVEFAELARQRGAAFVSLSDHGFTRARRIVLVNALLARMGLLRYRNDAVAAFETVDWSRTRVFALAPGRLFFPRPDSTLKNELIALFRELRDPETGEHPIAGVARREKLYAGPYVERASELLLLPRDGIDLKADFSAGPVFETPSVLVGTHTHGNAYWFASEGDSEAWVDDEQDVAGAGREVMRMLGVGGSV